MKHPPWRFRKLLRKCSISHWQSQAFRFIKIQALQNYSFHLFLVCRLSEWQMNLIIAALQKADRCVSLWAHKNIMKWLMHLPLIYFTLKFQDILLIFIKHNLPLYMPLSCSWKNKVCRVVFQMLNYLNVITALKSVFAETLKDINELSNLTQSKKHLNFF